MNTFTQDEAKKRWYECGGPKLLILPRAVVNKMSFTFEVGAAVFDVVIEEVDLGGRNFDMKTAIGCYPTGDQCNLEIFRPTIDPFYSWDDAVAGAARWARELVEKSEHMAQEFELLAKSLKLS